MGECTTYRPMIGAREGELSLEESAALSRHLAGCPGCGAFAADLAATEGLVSEALLAAAARRDFAPFVDQVLARVAADRPVSLLERLRRGIRLHPGLSLGGALAPVVAALALVMYLRGGSSNDLAAASSLEVHAEGRATTIIQSADGPLVLFDDDDDAS
ncbi:MAG: zf-HC2 domain-containing protein [Anaeromyxobacter sp.]|nr:zf-HC2 domain-containing protein [Anaeromyxobacter sp.]